MCACARACVRVSLLQTQGHVFFFQGLRFNSDKFLHLEWWVFFFLKAKSECSLLELTKVCQIRLTAEIRSSLLPFGDVMSPPLICLCCRWWTPASWIGRCGVFSPFEEMSVPLENVLSCLRATFCIKRFFSSHDVQLGCLERGPSRAVVPLEILGLLRSGGGTNAAYPMRCGAWEESEPVSYLVVVKWFPFFFSSWPIDTRSRPHGTETKIHLQVN